MRFHTFLNRLLLALVLCVVAGTTALADVPDAPENLAATTSWDQWSSSYTWTNVVTLTWRSSTADTDKLPLFYSVYGADGQKLDYTGFDAVYENIPSRLQVDSNGYWYSTVDVPLPGGTYSFYVNSANGDGTSEPSNIVTIDVADIVTLYINEYPKAQFNEPSAVAQIDEDYMFQVGAVTEGPNPIRYSLAPFQNALPAGLAIDEETGVLTWHPTVGGMYYFKVQATLVGYPGIVYEAVASILVRQCEANSTWITGTITDQNGNPMTEGIVSLTPDDSSEGRRAPLVCEISTTGTYQFNVDAGSYILGIDGGDYVPEYYEDALNYEDATPIVVECGQSQEVNMEVRHITNYTVSGRVTNLDGEGIFASVVFTGYNASFPIDQRYPIYRRVETEEDGTYSIELPDNLTFIASAQYVVRNNTGVVELVQFFDHVGNIAEATEFVLTADRSDINFEFSQSVEFQNSLGGFVKLSGAESGTQAYVIAYKVSGDNQFYMATVSAGDGSYDITNLEPGDYVVYATPYDYTISPGYYKEGEDAVPSWDDATRITIGEDTNLGGLIVSLLPVDTTDGEGLVQGSVRGDASGLRTGGDGKTQQTLGDDAINGALITLIDDNGNVARYNFSATTGAFSLDRLHAGVYTIVIDKIGFSPYKGTVEIKNEQEPVGVNVKLESAIATGVNEEANNVVARAYPNPATNNVMLSFRATNGMARVAVVNAAGTEVMTAQKQTIEGDNALLLNTQNLSAGAYFIRLTMDGRSYTLPLQIVR